MPPDPTSPVTYRARALRLPCRHCELPFAVVEGDSLVITSTHHGAKHENRIALTEVLTLLIDAGRIVRVDLDTL